MKVKRLGFAKRINIGALNIEEKYWSVMNQPFTCLRQGSKTFVDLKERDTLRSAQFQPRKPPIKMISGPCHAMG